MCSDDQPCLRLLLRSMSLCRLNNWRNHSAAASRSWPLTLQLSDASTIIGISSFALVTIYDSIRLALFELIWLSFYNSIRLPLHLFIINLIHIILIPFHKRSMESYIGQSVLKKNHSEIVEYSRILKTRICFGEDTLHLLKNQRKEGRRSTTGPTSSSINPHIYYKIILSDCDYRRIVSSQEAKRAQWVNP